ncbi:hypothetical protein [Streptomyces sp. NPDC127098]|uniref:hypothetical protein n=1 Tax=Streptomyces sp. NPDC127098 TaxID=3347137 RepID=UPI0036525E5F
MRWRTVTAVACVVAVLAGCVSSADDEARAPGQAGVEVTVVRGDRTYPLTAEIVAWELGPHPQVPQRADAVHFSYRTVRTESLPETMVELGVCAVDSADVVVLCDVIVVHDSPVEPRVVEADAWIGAGSDMDLSGTAAVVLLPDQLRPGLHAGDPKDDDGYRPPRLPLPGEHLRVGGAGPTR